MTRWRADFLGCLDQVSFLPVIPNPEKIVCAGVNLCSAVSYFAVVPLARRFGLVNTMVFTHLPSSMFLILTAFAPTASAAFGLLILRALLSQMDVPTRSSYVMAVATPDTAHLFVFDGDVWQHGAGPHHQTQRRRVRTILGCSAAQPLLGGACFPRGSAITCYATSCPLLPSA